MMPSAAPVTTTATHRTPPAQLAPGAHLVIVGGGVIGLTTAYAAVQRGLRVTLLEAAADVALGTSAANGGMLHVSHTEPWNAPGIAGVLLRALVDPAAAVRAHPGALIGQIGWAASFLWHARRAPFRAATVANAALATHALGVLRRWFDAAPDLAAACDFRASGILKVYHDARALSAHTASAERNLAPLGIRFERLDRDGCLAREPCLVGAADALAGGLWFPDDAVGDAARFCRALAAWLARQPAVRLLTATPVAHVRLHRGRFDSVVTGAGDAIAGDACVVACGVDVPRLVRPLGLRVNLAPVRGYSLTLPGDALPRPLTTPLIDDHRKIVVTPLGRSANNDGFPDRLRIAGGADIAGHRRDTPRPRLTAIAGAARALLPDLADFDVLDPAVRPWAGLRPMPARGRPWIGPSPIPGLWLNAAPGHLGWTLAAGAADWTAGALTGEPDALAAVARFADA